jgi:hypothetical protein
MNVVITIDERAEQRTMDGIVCQLLLLLLLLLLLFVLPLPPLLLLSSFSMASHPTTSSQCLGLHYQLPKHVKWQRFALGYAFTIETLRDRTWPAHGRQSCFTRRSTLGLLLCSDTRRN